MSLQNLTLRGSCLSLLLSLTPFTFAENNSAHVHGEANLVVVYEGGDLVLELDTPALNILGFEHAPRNAEQNSRLDSAVKMLETPDSVITVNEECSLKIKDIDSPFAQQSHDKTEHERHKHHDNEAEHDHEHEHHDHGHSDFQIKYHWQCEGVKRLNIQLHLIERFPNIEKIHAQWIAFDKQGANILRKENNTLEIKP